MGKDKEKQVEQDYLKKLEETFKQGAHLRPPSRRTDSHVSSFLSKKSSEDTQSQIPEELEKQPVIPQLTSPKVFKSGDILILEDGSIAIYKQKITGKEYDLVYILNTENGKAAPKGIYVSGYESEKIGSLPDEIFSKLQKTMVWNRDAIIYHLDKFIYCSRIPQIKYQPVDTGEVTQVEEAPVTQKLKPSESKKELLQKGRKLLLMFGDKEWESYYWGTDELGTIVVHSTTGEWTAMHLDLKRFGDSIKYGELLPPNEIKRINDLILQK